MIIDTCPSCGYIGEAIALTGQCFNCSYGDVYPGDDTNTANCTICGHNGRYERHHVLPRALSKRYPAKNGIRVTLSKLTLPLCLNCHRELTAKHREQLAAYKLAYDARNIYSVAVLDMLSANALLDFMNILAVCLIFIIVRLDYSS